MFNVIAYDVNETAAHGRRQAHGSAGGRLRITARGKRLVATLAFVPALLGLGVMAAQPAIAAVSGAASSSLETVTVQSGQTLWEVAASITVDRDVRDVVSDLQRLNGIDSAHVEPGQVLVLPEAR